MSETKLSSELNTESIVLKEYCDLLVRRDHLLQVANSNKVKYTAEFGDILIKNLELKIECIKAKKSISYCRRRLNRGLSIDANCMLEEVEREMKLYYVQLQELISAVHGAKNAKVFSSEVVRRAKEIYRRLAKVLHPDVNLKTTENKVLEELWIRVARAYHNNDIDELEDLEVLVHRTLDELGIDGFELDCSNIEGRIERIEHQINEILNTEPYTFGEILDDERKKSEYKDRLLEERKDFEQYLETLKNSLDEMLCDGGVTWVIKTN